MNSSLARLNKTLAEMRVKIAEHKQIAKQAQETLDNALETGAIVQRAYCESEPERQEHLDTVSDFYAELKEIIAEHTLAAEQLEVLEDMGDRLRSVLLPYGTTRRRE